MCKVSWIKKSIHNMESANKTCTVKLLQEFFGRKAFHDMESTLWYFPQCGKYNLNFLHWGNYIVDCPLHRKNGKKLSTKLEVKNLCSTMCKVSWIKKSIHIWQCGKC